MSSEHQARTSRRSIYLTSPISSGTRLDPVQTTLHRLESRVQLDQRSDIVLSTRHHGREDSPHLLQQPAQLPSFRDIIPPHLQPPPDTQYQSPHILEAPSDTLTPSTQGLSATPRSIVTSPTHSQGSSMPSLTGEFDEMNVRSSEALFSTPAHTMGTMDRGTPWMTATQYQGMPATYAQPTQRVSQINPQPVSSRTSPSLPPIRDINQRTSSSYDPTYATPAGQMNHVTQLGSYPQMYATSQPTAIDIDSTFGRSMSYNDGPYPRYTTSYPTQNSRAYQTNDITRFNSTPYDYRYNSSAYRTSFGDMNYAPHAMVSSQPAPFGVQGDLSGGASRRRRGNLPKQVTDMLKAWFHEHLDHPYPSEEDKQLLISKTGLTISQISNWFINARRRHWPALRQNREQLRNTALRRSNSAGGSV